MNPDQDQQGPQPMPTPMPPSPPEQTTPPPAPNPVDSVPPTPNPFAAPTGPIGSSPVAASSPMPASTGGSKKKLIIILSAVVGGLLILGGIAAAVYFLFFAVSKQDYQQAYDQMNVIRESIDGTSIAATANSKDVLTEASAAYEAYKVEHDKLGELKAIKFDSEVNDKYKVYAAKADEYIVFMDVYMPSVIAFLDASSALESFSLTTAGVQRVIDAFEDVSGKVTDPNMKDFVDSALVAFKRMLPQIKIYEDTSNSNSERLAAANELNRITLELSTASTTLSKDLSDRTKAISPEDSFNELIDLITKKLNEA